MHPLPPGTAAPRFAALLLMAAIAASLAGCGGDSSSPAAPAPPPAPAPTPEPATASYMFAQPDDRIGPRQPGTLPEGVSFSLDLILVAHARDAAPFSPDEISSDGMKMLAETGNPEGLLAEAEENSSEVIAKSLPELLQIFLNPNHAVVMNLDQPCLSYAERIQPSPDWFIGFSNICATNDDGKWRDMVQTQLLAYDAGTADGDGYSNKTEGGDSEPREPITLLNKPPHFVAPAIVQVLTATRKAE